MGTNIFQRVAKSPTLIPQRNCYKRLSRTLFLLLPSILYSPFCLPMGI